MTDSIWSALNKLRWYETRDGKQTLQQAWIHHGTWEEEWRDVPTVKEGEDR